MAKKLTVPKQTFVDMDIYDPHYQIRYRIVSEDRNRLSEWSPIYSIDPEVVFIPGNINTAGQMVIQKNTGYVSISWDSVNIYKDNDKVLSDVAVLPYYDVWIRWAQNSGLNPSNWIYQQRISSTSFNINVPASYIDENGITRTTPKYLYVEIYRPGRPIIRYEKTETFTQNASTIDTTNDYIYFASGNQYSTGAAVVYTSATPITGLTSTTTYYIRVINYYQVSLHPTKSDAQNNLNKMNLSGSPSGTGTFTGYPFRMYSGLITTL
jgi:hypothetical protein